MGSFFDEFFSDPKSALKRRVSTSSNPNYRHKKDNTILQISSPVLTHASGIYSNTSPDRSTFLTDLPSSGFSSQSPSELTEDDAPSLPREPRYSCPDIRAHKAKDHEYRARKMQEFESLIESSKVLRYSISNDFTSP